MRMTLHAVPNPDYPDTYHNGSVSLPESTVEVKTLSEASDALCQWIALHDLGSGNLTPDCGNVYDGETLVAHISYNGRIWSAPEGVAVYESEQGFCTVPESDHGPEIMQSALEAIANMKVYKDTDYSKLAALCVTIAHVTLEKVNA